MLSARSSLSTSLQAAAMSVLDRLTVAVTFDPAKGYIASVPDRPAPVRALSLNGLRRRIEALLLPDDAVVLRSLDRAARMERERRRAKMAGRVQSTSRPSEKVPPRRG